VLLLNRENSIDRRPGDIVEVDGQSSVFSTGQQRAGFTVDAHCGCTDGKDSGRLPRSGADAM
jgi:hypothetical protein